VASYTNNNLNQITSRDVPGYLDIKGNSIATMLARNEGFSIWDLIDICRQVCGAQIADIEFIPNGDTRIGLELPIQLPMSNVEGLYSGGAVLKKTIGESADVSAQIRTDTPGGDNIEDGQCRFELISRPGNKRPRCPAGGIRQGRRWGQDNAVKGHMRS